MALLKPATQSETLWSYDANLAVDGDANTCSFTPQSDVQRWWQVWITSMSMIANILWINNLGPSEWITACWIGGNHDESRPISALHNIHRPAVGRKQGHVQTLRRVQGAISGKLKITNILNDFIVALPCQFPVLFWQKNCKKTLKPWLLFGIVLKLLLHEIPG